MEPVDRRMFALETIAKASAAPGTMETFASAKTVDTVDEPKQVSTRSCLRALETAEFEYSSTSGYQSSSPSLPHIMDLLMFCTIGFEMCLSTRTHQIIFMLPGPFVLDVEASAMSQEATRVPTHWWLLPLVYIFIRLAV